MSYGRAQLNWSRNAKRFAGKATFSLSQAQPTRIIIRAQLKHTTSWRPMRTSRLTGVTRRSSKRDYAWKRKAIEPAPLRRFTRYWRTRRARISSANCSGITKLDLTLVDCWRKIQSGNLPLLSMISSLPREGAEAKKQKRVLIVFASNIFFGRTESSVAATVHSLSAKSMGICLQQLVTGLTITA